MRVASEEIIRIHNEGQKASIALQHSLQDQLSQFQKKTNLFLSSYSSFQDSIEAVQKQKAQSDENRERLLQRQTLQEESSNLEYVQLLQMIQKTHKTLFQKYQDYLDLEGTLQHQFSITTSKISRIFQGDKEKQEQSVVSHQTNYFNLSYDEKLDGSSLIPVFFGAKSLGHLIPIFHDDYHFFILSKLNEDSSRFPQQKIFLKHLVWSIYNMDYQISPAVINVIQEKIMQNDVLEDYLIFLLFAEKTFKLKVKIFQEVEVDQRFSSNLQTIIHNYFVYVSPQIPNKVHILYMILLFCHQSKIGNTKTILSEMQNSFIFQMNELWICLYDHILKNNTRQFNERVRKTLVENFLSMMNRQSPEIVKEKSFEEVSSLIFASSLSFERISELLTIIAQHSGTQLSLVKGILQKNHHLSLQFQSKIVKSNKGEKQ